MLSKASQSACLIRLFIHMNIRDFCVLMSRWFLYSYALYLLQFLSMKLATVNPQLDFNVEGLLVKDVNSIANISIRNGILVCTISGLLYNKISNLCRSFRHEWPLHLLLDFHLICQWLIRLCTHLNEDLFKLVFLEWEARRIYFKEQFILS